MFDWVAKLGIGRNVSVEDVSTGERYVVKGFEKEGMVSVRDNKGKHRSIFGGNLRRTEDRPAAERPGDQGGGLSFR